uniref:Zona pellucida sperm-binding protein 3 n=1 Tax=Gouania willdenowi TaxID=441366 RepID=A0A8C5H860_GOUWI
MGCREAVFLGFVFLFSGGTLLSSSVNITTNEPVNQTPAEQVTTSPQQARGHQSETSTPGRPRVSPLSYRLRSYQLRGPGGGSHRPELPLPPHVLQQTLTHSVLMDPRSLEATRLTSEQLERKEERLLHPGPDLNPPLPQGTKVQVKFEQRVPVSAKSVSVHCGERKVIVEVDRNFLGNGQLVRPTDVTLGGCSAVDDSGLVLHFHAEVHGCGSTLKMTDQELVYTFTLKYTPAPISNTFILKTNPSQVEIQCLYPRRHQVSSSGMAPTWNQFVSDIAANQRLRFSLRFMTDDWQIQRPSNVHFLSEVMHIEASVLQGHHVPLSVYVDSCVTTVSPDPASDPKYSFISDYGCFTDAKLTGAKSYFMQRSQEDKLHFQLKAFRFFHDDAKSFYITCHLKATLASVPIGPQRKACSYMTEAKRWVASDGDNRVCSCCETSCSEQRRKRSLASDDGTLEWEGTAALGPILLEERLQVSEVLPEIHSLPHAREVAQPGPTHTPHTPPSKVFYICPTDLPALRNF